MVSSLGRVSIHVIYTGYSTVNFLNLASSRCSQNLLEAFAGLFRDSIYAERLTGNHPRKIYIFATVQVRALRLRVLVSAAYTQKVRFMLYEECLGYIEH